MKNILLWLFCILLCYQLTADKPIHNSIYNTSSSSNAIYNSYNLFTENDNFPEKLNGKEDDLDVQDDYSDEDDDEEENASDESDNLRHNSLLQKSILNNDLAAVQNIINEGQIDKNYSNKDGRTALHFAAAQDDNQIVLLLLDKGADSSAQDLEGWTPLHVAVDANAFAVVKTLIEHHADLFAKNVDDKMPIDYAKNDMMKSLLNGYEI